MPFLNALRARNTQAIDHFKALVAGKRYRDHVVISALPKSVQNDAPNPTAIWGHSTGNMKRYRKRIESE